MISYTLKLYDFLLISSPEPLAHWWAYSIGRPLSSICMYVHVRVCSYVSQHFQTSSPLKPLGRLKPSSMWRLLGIEERNFVRTVQVTWPRWPPWPYMLKSLKNLLLRNQKAYDLETWYVASSAQVLPSLFKWWSWVDLDLFYGKVKFGPLCICMEKRSHNRFFRNCCSLWYQSWQMQLINLYEYQRSRSFIDLGPRSLRFNIFKLLFLRNR